MKSTASGAALGLALLVAGGASVVACDQLFDITERAELDGGADATGDAPGVDAASEGSAETGAGDAGSDAFDGNGADVSGSDGPASDGSSPEGPAPDAPACTTVYVSASKGADGNTGCDPSAPKQSVSSAITAAHASSSITRILVCAGTYPGALTLDVPVALLGGFDCTTWAQLGGYGYPTFAATPTVLTASGGPTLTVTGSTLTSSTRVDGFTIENLSTGPLTTTAAAVVVSAASPTLSNDHVVGGASSYTGAASPAPPASAGILVTQGGAPAITADLVEGGSGSTPVGASVGSIGIFADATSGPLTVTGSTIRGGTGTGTGTTGTGSEGLELTGSAGATAISYSVTNSTIVGGGGTVSGTGSCRATRGLFVNSGLANLTLTNDAVDGGDEVDVPGGATTGTLCPHGVEVIAAGSVVARGNRIYGGRCNIGAAALGQASLYGLFVGSGASLTAENNMIHMGVSSIPHGAAALGFGSSTPLVLRHNTLVGGTNTGTSAGALWLQGATQGAVVENNILTSAGPGTAATTVGLLLSCPSDAGPPTLASFRNNLVFATAGGLMAWENCNGAASYSTVDAMDAELVATQAGAPASGNVTLAGSTAACGGDSGCVVLTGCTTPAACLTTVFLGFDSASYGETNLFPTALFPGTCPTASQPTSGSGWPIAATPPCSVAQSTDDDVSAVPTDLYGNCRGSKPTMGAAEYAGASCQ